MWPVLVLETKEPQPKTKLVFSRGEIEPGKAAGPKWRTEALSLQTLVFEREQTPLRAFSKTGGARCTVRDTFKTRSDYGCCYRSVLPELPDAVIASSEDASIPTPGRTLRRQRWTWASLSRNVCLRGSVALWRKARLPGEFEPVSEKSAYSRERTESAKSPGELQKSNEYVSKPIKQEEELPVGHCRRTAALTFFTIYIQTQSECSHRHAIA